MRGSGHGSQLDFSASCRSDPCVTHVQHGGSNSNESEPRLLVRTAGLDQVGMPLKVDPLASLWRCRVRQQKKSFRSQEDLPTPAPASLEMLCLYQYVVLFFQEEGIKFKPNSLACITVTTKGHTCGIGS